MVETVMIVFAIGVFSIFATLMVLAGALLFWTYYDWKGINMKMDISEIILIANSACNKLKILSANASNTDLNAIATQNEILLYCYDAIKLWVAEQNQSWTIFKAVSFTSATLRLHPLPKVSKVFKDCKNSNRLAQ